MLCIVTALPANASHGTVATKPNVTLPSHYVEPSHLSRYLLSVSLLVLSMLLEQSSQETFVVEENEESDVLSEAAMQA